MPPRYSPAWYRLPYRQRFPRIYAMLAALDGAPPSDALCKDEALALFRHIALQENRDPSAYADFPDEVILSAAEDYICAVQEGRLPPPAPSVALNHPIRFN